MSVLQIGNPPGQLVPESEYKFNIDEDRFFLPGKLHSGNYIINAYAYYSEGEIRMEVRYLTPEVILAADKAIADKNNGHAFLKYFDNANLETFICENTADDPNFSYLNNAWLAYGISRTTHELIEWAKDNAPKGI